MRLPDEHPLAAVREWLKILIPGIALVAASTAAVIAFQQLNHLRTSTERQQRAYVLVTEGAIVNFESGEPKVVLKARNSGQTPAYKLTVEANASLGKFPLTEDLSTIALFKSSSGVVGPGGDYYMTVFMKQLTSDQRQAIKLGQAAIYLHGTVRYVDAFGISRWSTFRCYFGGNTGTPPNGQFSVAEDGNDAN
jgi:hypothetical protein